MARRFNFDRSNKFDFNQGNKNIVLNDLTQDREVVEALAAALSASTVDTTAGSFGATLMQNYAQDDGRVNAKDRRLGTWGTEASIINALDAAEDSDNRRGVVVYFPARSYDEFYEVGDGLDMSGRTSVIQGGGAYITSAGDWFGTVFKASTQDGPVLDLSAWENPAAFMGRVSIGGFALLGSGVGDPTKDNAGMRVKVFGSAHVHDITIAETGGPCLEGVVNAGNAQYLCEFDRITLNTPVDVQDNDVPWFIMNEANLALFSRIGFRHVGTDPSVGVSGAAIIDSPSGHAPSGGSVFSDWWMENLHVPDLGTLISSKGNFHTFRDCGFVDCFKQSGARETSHVKFLAADTADAGGNTWRGLIPGRDPDQALSIDYGIDMRQSYNGVDGAKGRDGHNVVIRGASTPSPLGALTGVTRTGITMRGSNLYSDTAGVDDQSGFTAGQYANRWMDFGTGETGGFLPSSPPYGEVSSNTTITKYHHTIVSNGASLTHTLPLLAAVPYGREFVIKNVHASSLTVDGNGSEGIDGAAGATLATGQSGTFVRGWTEWKRTTA